MNDHEWWRCRCGDHHQGRPRRVGALTGAGIVMHAPAVRADSSEAPA